MFNNVNKTSFVTNEANDFFGKSIISFTDESYDKTFLGTMRALIYPRLKGEKVYLNFQFSSYAESTIRNYSNNFEYKETSSKDLLNAITGFSDYDEYEPEMSELRICGINKGRGDMNTNAAFTFIENCFLKGYGDKWVRLNKVTDFFRKQFRAIAFINIESRRSIMFIDSIDAQKYHYAQCAIVALMPWFFEDGMSDEEIALINSLRERTPDNYISITNHMIEKYNLEEGRVKNLLDGYETSNLRSLLSDTESKINDLICTINNYKERIAECLRQKEEYECKMFGIHEKLSSPEESELIDFFLNSKYLHLEGVNGDELTFTVKSYIEFFDEDLVETMLEQRRSVLYNSSAARSISDSHMKMLIKAIFIDKTLKIRSCAAYRISSNGYIRALSSYEYGPRFLNYFPNIHIDRYSCLGTYERIIIEFLKVHDYVGAITQCVASCKSLNFGDYAVMNEFINRLNGSGSFDKYSRIPFLENAETGELMTVKQAIKYIIGENKEEEVDENE